MHFRFIQWEGTFLQLIGLFHKMFMLAGILCNALFCPLPTPEVYRLTKAVFTRGPVYRTNVSLHYRRIPSIRPPRKSIPLPFFATKVVVQLYFLEQFSPPYIIRGFSSYLKERINGINQFKYILSIKSTI